MKMRFTCLITALFVSSTLAAFVPLTKDCTKAITWEGEPKGVIKTINGVPTYIAKAGRNIKPKRALLFLTDIYGIPFVNSKLMADDFAAHGFDTFIPDYLLGDPAPFGDPGFNATAWFLKHTEAITMVPLTAAIEGLKKLGYKEFAATGYCFGGLYTTRLTQKNIVKVGTMAHPSLLTVPGDFEVILNSSKTPVQLNTAELDSAFPPASQAIVDGVLGGGKYKPGYNRTYFPGVVHGFAVRANLSDPIAKAAKEGAFHAAVEFLKAH